MAAISLGAFEDTERLGKLLAQLLAAHNYPPIFARGDLGSGKTALVSCIVRHMEGGTKAEVSSPSFTICNYYPTYPPTLHCDLYRCKGDVPDDILELADCGNGWFFVEWAEFYPKELLPKEYLDISFKLVKNSRLLEFSPRGENSKSLVHALFENWKRVQTKAQLPPR